MYARILPKAIYGDYGGNEWVCKVAETPEEARSLIEVNFEFLNTTDCRHLHRVKGLRKKNSCVFSLYFSEA